MKKLWMRFGNGLKRLNQVYFILIGIVSLLWFLVRVIPKPSRAAYPCQKVAFPIASGFIIWISVNIISFLGIKKLASLYKKKGKLNTLFACIGLVMFYVIWLTFSKVKESIASVAGSSELFVPTDSANTPIGVARGIFPGRVVWAFDTTFSKWTVTKGFWWDDKYTDQATVSDMISRSIYQISGKQDATAAWDTIFRYFNSRHGKGNIGYTAGEKIAIKLSLVQSGDPSSNGGNINFTPPQTVLALLRQLVYNAGVDAGNITFYDAMRSIPTSITQRCKKEFPKVHFAGSESGTYQEAVIRSTTSMHWSESLTMEIKGGNTAYLPTIITEASYIINLANLKGHHLAGITCCTKNHNGSFLSDGDPNTPHAIGMHCYFTVHDYTINGDPEWSFKGRDMGTYNVFVDVMGHKDLGEKTLLFIIDGLYSVPTEGVPNTNVLRWQQTPFNNHFSSSIFMSQDNVAIESVALDFFRTEQAINPNLIFKWEDGSSTHNVIYGNVDNYLHEAAQADNPPSGTKYAPNGDGVRLSSLGVHEHWNNPIDKKYTRNLGTGNGIELDMVSPALPAPANLVSELSGNISIDLSWSTGGSTDGNLVIFKSSGTNINFKPLDTINGSATSYEDTAISDQTLCYYRIKRITNNAYSPFSNETNTAITGIINNNVINFSFNIYPNPANQYINLNFSHPYIGMTNLVITDITGRIVMKSGIQKTGTVLQQSIDISKLQKGIYFIELSFRSVKFNKPFQIL